MSASIDPGERPGTWVVRLDGRDQSAVDLDDPTRLDFDYVRRTGQLLDRLEPRPPARLRVLHVGGAGLSLPRFVAARRPGSRQVVLEPDGALTALVRERLPLPPRSAISVREQDGRAGVGGVRDGWADAVVVDAYTSAEVPDELLTRQWWRELRRVTDPAGTVVLNLVDRAPFARARGAVAAAREAFGSVRVGAETATLRGRRPGNLLLVAGPVALPDAGGPDYRWLDDAATASALGGGTALVDGWFRRLGPGRLQPTGATEGAWSQAEQHLGPTVGLCVHELLRAVAPHPELGLARLSLDALGTMTLDPVEVRVEVLRRGRTIELDEVVVTQAGRPVVRARAWRLARYDTAAAAGGSPDRLPPPDAVEPWRMSQRWGGRFIAGLDVRVEGGAPEPGRARAWVHADTAVVLDEAGLPEEAPGPDRDLPAWAALLDVANGTACLREPGEWLFPNVDLSLHLHRVPTGTWLGLDTTVVLGADGLGTTSSTVHDLDGPVGRLEQQLTVRPRPRHDDG